MKALILFVVWFILLSVSWPLAIVALVLWPLVLLVWIPLAIVGISVSAALALLRAVLFLPARILGYRA